MAATKKVGIIGAGAAGLVSLRHFLDCLGFRPVVWEQSRCVGGTWVYSDNTHTDEHGLPVHSSMYKSLKTNLPKEVMAFPDFPFKSEPDSFLHHTKILDYLKDYCHNYNLLPHIKFGHVVEHVEPSDVRRRDTGWQVTVRDLESQDKVTEKFDALIVCNGHYSIPVMAKLKGIEAFKGLQMHSHCYREPDPFEGRRVLVLGASASGMDISLEVATKAKQVYLSHNLPTKHPSKLPENIEQVAGAVAVREGTTDTLVLKDGSEVVVDAILYCTGYQYTFPFLSEACQVVVADSQVKPLYKHLIHALYPTMAFPGIPAQICPFPVFDVQVRFFRSLLKNDFRMPAEEEVATENDSFRQVQYGVGRADRHFHKLGDLQWGYLDSLVHLSGITPLNATYKDLYNHVWEARRESVTTYKDNCYRLTSPSTFEEV